MAAEKLIFMEYLFLYSIIAITGVQNFYRHMFVVPSVVSGLRQLDLLHRRLEVSYFEDRPYLANLDWITGILFISFSTLLVYPISAYGFIIMIVLLCLYSLFAFADFKLFNIDLVSAWIKNADMKKNDLRNFIKNYHLMYKIKYKATPDIQFNTDIFEHNINELSYIFYDEYVKFLSRTKNIYPVCESDFYKYQSVFCLRETERLPFIYCETPSSNGSILGDHYLANISDKTVTGFILQRSPSYSKLLLKKSWQQVIGESNYTYIMLFAFLSLYAA